VVDGAHIKGQIITKYSVGRVISTQLQLAWHQLGNYKNNREMMCCMTYMLEVSTKTIRLCSLLMMALMKL
jgi:hypothetical protein